MTPDTPSQTSRARIPFIAALVVILAMAVAYTVLDTLQPQEPILSILAFIPGVVSLVVLFAAGLTHADTNLRLARLSWSGAGVLAAVTVLMLPFLGSSTSFVGWQWLPALVHAPASGIAQELYFRSSLLPALERALPGRKTIVLLLHSAIFIGFHYRTFQSIASIGPSLIVAVVLFAAGCGWGWQVQRDRTVVWAMVQHSLFLVLMSMFGWG
jgi:membrane protease YdiL (CAAX protease family)